MEDDENRCTGIVRRLALSDQASTYPPRAVTNQRVYRRYSLRVVPRQKSAMLRAVSRLTSGAAIGKISVACIVPMT